MTELVAKKVVGVECKHVVYVPPPYGGAKDLHFVKEVVHYDDKTTEPRLNYIWDYKQKFWITKKGFQKHQQKKEWENIDRLHQFESTVSDLTFNIGKALQKPFGKNKTLRDLAASPYLYGTDVSSKALIKKRYQLRAPNAVSLNSVSIFDVETDVVHGTGEIIMASLTFRDRAVLCITKDATKGYSDFVGEVQRKIKQHLDPVLEAIAAKTKQPVRKIDIKIVVCDNALEVLKVIFMHAHQWKPDFLAIWNMDFDIPKILEVLEKYDYPAAELFSDPDVPKEYKYFKYKRGNDKKVTHSGKQSPIHPAKRWHTVYTPASFYVLDAMCTYRQIRVNEAERPSYALDALLKENGLGGKLDFKEADEYSGLDWHQQMQKHFMPQYCVYNLWDCISVEMLDEQLLDMRVTLPTLAGATDYDLFNRQPTRVATELHFECLNNGKVMGTTASEMDDGFDAYTVSPKGWIVTLAAERLVENGIPLFSDLPNLRSSVRVGNGDLDVSGAYPSNGIAWNVSKATTRKEITEVFGVSNASLRRQGLNLSGGFVNAVEFCTELYGLPPLHGLLESFKRDMVSQ